MLITQKSVEDKEKMSDPATNVKPKNTKLGEKCIEVKNFYNKHFPTDRKSFNLRLPFVALVLSILTTHFVCANFAVKDYVRRSANTIVQYCYIFIATAVTYELYYGLKIGDRKQFTPWIILKFIEFCLTLATIIYIFVDERYNLKFLVPDIIYGIIVLGLNGLVLYIVAKRSLKQLRGYARKTDHDENVYDTYTYDDA